MVKMNAKCGAFKKLYVNSFQLVRFLSPVPSLVHISVYIVLIKIASPALKVFC